LNTPRTRILLVTRNLPPLVGGMERLNWHMAEELAKVADVRAVGPEGSAALAPAGVDVREAPLKPLWKFLWQARSLARREAKTWRPHIVLAGSGLTAPIARSAARLCGARTAVYVHGLDVAVRHPVYRAVWLPAIRNTDRVIANSRATAELCRDIGVDPSRIGIVHPGVDLPAAVEPLSRRERGRGEGPAPRDPFQGNASVSGQGDWARSAGGMKVPEARPLLLSVGRLSARKGLREFVTLALPRIVAAQPKTMLLIVGDAPNQALRAEAQTPQSIQVAADAAGVGEHLKFLGTITDYAKLGSIYRASDVHVFPVREIPGDPEGFGMVAVEAAAHGLPTVAFATGGIIDAVAEGESGHLVKSEDYDAFAESVLQAFAAHEGMHSACVSFSQRFAWPVFGDKVAVQLRNLRSPASHRQPTAA
jgi:phosphatidylinositol alpha-1,6-mannosyltransferase